ncbi:MULTISPECIES: hypothetical protein [unclassified Pseudomonas]|uniref:hypothetical protein n=1 Tax=unclassified Pseudomonas TaxID=196821 RepID=UPI002449B441|nr:MULTISPECIES: hypothetical protein [unclassified Pseudomonas]MDG9927414.1 hypothetical protein [Pseudomonas sp. GD04042]MDH0482483.1 hypothetical protein [Pseudomonas sp. GD04015]MDH0602835.1 hypothetical protein [Pseudomonas sp. GD03869]
MSEYKLSNENWVTRVSDGARISTSSPPTDPNENPDYLEYKAWLAGGGVPIPADPLPATVPDEVTMRQAKLALLAAGLLDDVETALDGLPGDEGRAARIEWEYSSVMRRDKPFVVAIGSAVGLSGEQIDQLFIAAAGIE